MHELVVSPVVLCGNEDSKEGLDSLARNTSTSNSKTKQYSESITVCKNQSQSPSLTQQVTLTPVSLQAPNHQSRSYTNILRYRDIGSAGARPRSDGREVEDGGGSSRNMDH
ncbi:unnamed protein product [Timema podura]|uniref:Uncharacterized protein n=1 Tax=Timema podura TaxID=61482 RepID=A0ABN7NQH4_TIMPD|nr:unnamed protein product [Timema podura]